MRSRRSRTAGAASGGGPFATPGSRWSCHRGWPALPQAEAWAQTLSCSVPPALSTSTLGRGVRPHLSPASSRWARSSSAALGATKLCPATPLCIGRGPSQVAAELTKLGLVEKRRLVSSRAVGLYVTETGRRIAEEGVAREHDMGTRLRELLGDERYEQLEPLGRRRSPTRLRRRQLREADLRPLRSGDAAPKPEMSFEAADRQADGAITQRWRSSNVLVQLLARRWTLAVLLELVTGGCRCQDLHDALDGICTRC